MFYFYIHVCDIKKLKLSNLMLIIFQNNFFFFLNGWVINQNSLVNTLKNKQTTSGYPDNTIFVNGFAKYRPNFLPPPNIVMGAIDGIPE